MGFRADRNSLLGKIADLQRKQETTASEAQQQNWTFAEHRLAFDERLNRIATLMRELIKLEEHQKQKAIRVVR